MDHRAIAALTILAFGTAAHADLTISGEYSPVPTGERRPVHSGDFLPHKPYSTSAGYTTADPTIYPLKVATTQFVKSRFIAGPGEQYLRIATLYRDAPPNHRDSVQLTRHAVLTWMENQHSYSPMGGVGANVQMEAGVQYYLGVYQTASNIFTNYTIEFIGGVEMGYIPDPLEYTIHSPRVLRARKGKVRIQVTVSATGKRALGGRCGGLQG